MSVVREGGLLLRERVVVVVRMHVVRKIWGKIWGKVRMGMGEVAKRGYIRIAMSMNRLDQHFFPD